MICGLTWVAIWWLVGALPGAAWSYHCARTERVPRRRAFWTSLPMGAAYGFTGPFILAAMAFLWFLFKVLGPIATKIDAWPSNE